MPNFIEICAGAGGLSTGLINKGFKPLLLVEIDKDCCETLKLNHGLYKDKVLQQDVNHVDFSVYKNKCDLLCGGVPCQSFSHAGKRNGLQDTRGNLLIKFCEIINDIKPKVFMIENVKGLKTHGKGDTLNHVLILLNKDDDYNISYEVLNAFDYEVPQKRERLIIIGVLKKLKKSFRFPAKVDVSKRVYLKNVLKDCEKNEGFMYPENKIRLFKKIPQGGCWINLPLEDQIAYLGKSFYSSGGKRGILHRLSMEKPSLTLLCSPSQKQTERCHPTETRPLNIKEYARIQTFKDDYNFYGSLSSRYKQIGNAVPVKLAEYIADQIMKIF